MHKHALTNTHATTGTTGISNDGVAGANRLPGGVVPLGQEMSLRYRVHHPPQVHSITRYHCQVDVEA